MEYIWKKIGDALDWIKSWFGYKQAKTKKRKQSDVEIDLETELECSKLECKPECVCQETEKVAN